MNKEEELSDGDPFGEEEEAADKENLITEAMIRKATYHIHKLAEQRKRDFKEIQTKCKKLFGYTNLAKVTLEDGHALIDKLIELTGGEEEEPTRGQESTQLLKKPGDGISAAEAAAMQTRAKEREKEKKALQLPTKPDDGLPKREIKKEPAEKVGTKTEEDDLVTATMRKSIRAAVDITLKEVVEKEVPVQGLGGFVLEIGKVIFDAKMREDVPK